MATSRPNSTLARREKRFPAMVGAFSPTHPHARRCCTMNELPTLTPPLSAEVASPRVLQGVGTLTGAAHPMPERGAIEVAWARHEDEVRQAQRLRFDVFAAEMGARLTTPIAGHDVDLFDDYCEHLMVRNQLDTMIGCASIPMLHNGVVSGDAAASIWQQVRKTHLAPIEYHVLPRLPLPVEQLDGSITVEPPALIKGYLRLGARVLGAPAWDPDFNTADLPMLMRLADLHPRYRKDFLGALCAPHSMPWDPGWSHPWATRTRPKTHMPALLVIVGTALSLFLICIWARRVARRLRCWTFSSTTPAITSTLWATSSMAGNCAASGSGHKPTTMWCKSCCAVRARGAGWCLCRATTTNLPARS